MKGRGERGGSPERTLRKKGELESNLQLRKKGRAVPGTTPPLEADASNLHGSFQQTMRCLTNKGTNRRGTRVMHTNRGNLDNVRGSTGPPNPRITTTDPDLPSTTGGRHGGGGR